MSIETTRAWIEVSKKKLINNYNIAKKLAAPSDVMCVVKANAYGHGLEIVGKVLQEEGASFFAVATLSEAINLRKSGITKDILIFGYTDIKEANYLIEYDLIQAGIDFEYVERINKLNLGVRLHLAVDTGMHRIGCDARKKQEIEKLFHLNGVKIEGIFSHLCAFDFEGEKQVEFSKYQIALYTELVDFLKQKHSFITHLLKSVSILLYQNKFDYIRPGSMLYGLISPTNEKTTSVGLQTIMSVKARVGRVFDIKENECIGYGLTFKSEKPMKIATISIGFADGIPRSMSNKGKVIVNGKYAKIVGLVCMDQLMVDITDVGNVDVGDIVTLVGREKDAEISAYEIAAFENTTPNAFFSNLNFRLPRILVE